MTLKEYKTKLAENIDPKDLGELTRKQIRETKRAVLYSKTKSVFPKSIDELKWYLTRFAKVAFDNAPIDMKIIQDGI